MHSIRVVQSCQVIFGQFLSVCQSVAMDTEKSTTIKRRSKRKKEQQEDH